jgi:hypothetical protein
MEQQIKTILAGTDNTIQKRGNLWSIRVGHHAGARANGVTLAHDLLAKYRIERGEPIAHPTPVTVSGEEMRGAAPEASPQPEPPTVIEKTVEVEKIVENPETQERLAEALRKLDEANAALESRKAGASVPPPEIADLIRLNESYERTDERLVALFNEAKQKAYLAMNRDGTYEGLSAVAWEKKAERYDSAIQWNRGRQAEAI